MPIFKPYILNNDPYRGGAVRDGQIIYKMSSNENPLGPSPKALLAVQQHLGEIGEYAFESDQRLTGKLSHFFGDRLEARQFLPGNGGMELLDLICRAFLMPGDSCIISSPAFMAYRNFVALAGARIIDVPLLKDTFDLDVDGILASIDHSTRLIFITNPNNPTGSFIPKRDVGKLIDQLPGDVMLVYDEVYYQYADDVHYPAAIDYVAAGRPVIGLHSFSKAYGLAGLRLGYLFSSVDLTAYLRHLRRPFMVNNLSMEAGMAALDDHDHISATLANNHREKYRLYRTFDEMGIRYWPSQTNFILFQPGMNPEKFIRFLIKRGIMVRNADVMGAPGCVRVTIGTPQMNDAFLAAFSEIFHTPEARY